MADLVLRLVEGWTLATEGGSEDPLVRDVDLGERLGYERPRDVRKLIERLTEDGKIGPISKRAAVARYEIRPGVWHPGQPADEYWLSEAQALKVAAKSETEPADALLDEMIRVFMLARRGLLTPPPATTSPPARLADVELAAIGALKASLERGDDVEAGRITSALGAMIATRSPGPLTKAPSPPPPSALVRTSPPPALTDRFGALELRADRKREADLRVAAIMMRYIREQNARGRGPTMRDLQRALGDEAIIDTMNNIRRVVRNLMIDGMLTSRPETRRFQLWIL